MKIEIYLGAKPQEPLAEITETSHKLVWSGTVEELNINSSKPDEFIPESVFDACNIDRRPKGYTDDLRAVSIGDVVVPDYRAYQYLTTGWKRLERF